MSNLCEKRMVLLGNVAKDVTNCLLEWKEISFNESSYSLPSSLHSLDYTVSWVRVDQEERGIPDYGGGIEHIFKFGNMKTLGLC